MKATLTQVEWQHVAELLLEGQQLLASVDWIERQIASTLDIAPGGEASDAITDAVAGVLTLDALLRTLNIEVIEASSDGDRH